MRIEKLVEQHNEMWDAYMKWNERLNLKKSKYKFGDYIRTNDGIICIGRIVFNEGEVYYSKESISLEGVPKNWDAWYEENDVEPYEPKDGEYFALTSKYRTAPILAISNGIVTLGDKLGSYCYTDFCGVLNLNHPFGYQFGDKLRPATPEEKQLLDDKLKEQGKRWNAEKKCIEDLPNEPQIGDMCIFWDNEKEYAVCALYGGAKHDYFMDTTGAMWQNCIPFESVEQYKNFIKDGN